MRYNLEETGKIFEMTTPTLYLLRHGRDSAEFRGGWSERGLIEPGIGQVEALVSRLKSENFQPDTLLSSDLARAAQTAQLIGAALNLTPHPRPEWREVNNGSLAGLPNAEADQRFPDYYWAKLAWDEQYGGGDSPARFYQRIEGALSDLRFEIEQNKIGPVVLLVTHAGPIQVVSAIVEGQQWTNQSKLYPVGQTSLHSFRLQNDRWSSLRLNDLDHLKE